MQTPSKNANKWWVRLWALNATALIIGAFFVPFRWWTLWAIIAFGSMETVGLISQRKTNRLPPLTDVIRCYIPRWACLAAMGALLSSAASLWGIGWNQPWHIALLFGVLMWLTTHFTQRYLEPADD